MRPLPGKEKPRAADPPHRLVLRSELISIPYFAQRVTGDLGELTNLAAEVASGHHHFLKQIPKRRGGMRTLRLPDGVLSPVLKKTLEFFYGEGWVLPETAFGFIPKRSAVGHAKNHLAQPIVLHVDLKDFFSHISAEQVRTSLEEFNFESDAAILASNLLTYDDGLPQGFATSPYLSNLAFAQTDRDLLQVAQKAGVNYSRYADDLVFSGTSPEDILDEVRAVTAAKGWPVNEAKVRTERRGQRQYVSGLTVFDGERPRLPRRLKRAYRLKAHLIKKVGYETYCLEFGGEDLEDHPRRLIGMARYMASVEPDFGRPLLRSFLENIDQDFMPRDPTQWDAEIDAIRNGW